jgi:hypothetical protein
LSAHARCRPPGVKPARRQMQTPQDPSQRDGRAGPLGSAYESRRVGTVQEPLAGEPTLAAWTQDERKPRSRDAAPGGKAQLARASDEFPEPTVITLLPADCSGQARSSQRAHCARGAGFCRLGDNSRGDVWNVLAHSWTEFRPPAGRRTRPAAMAPTEQRGARWRPLRRRTTCVLLRRCTDAGRWAR